MNELIFTISLNHFKLSFIVIVLLLLLSLSLVVVMVMEEFEDGDMVFQ